MVFVARPLLARIVSRWSSERLSRDGIMLVFFALLVSALITEAIGIHAIFGAFLLGAVIPRDSVVSRHLPRQLELGVISPTRFAMMVIMALAGALMTAPLLSLLGPQAED